MNNNDFTNRNQSKDQLHSTIIKSEKSYLTDDEKLSSILITKCNTQSSNGKSLHNKFSTRSRNNTPLDCIKSLNENSFKKSSIDDSKLLNKNGFENIKELKKSNDKFNFKDDKKVQNNQNENKIKENVSI